MKSLLARIAVVLLASSFAAAPRASAGLFDFWKPHKYRSHGHIYTHRAWVKPNRGFAGYYRYW